MTAACVVACAISREQAAHVQRAVGSRTEVRAFPDFGGGWAFMRSAAIDIEAVLVGDAEMPGRSRSQFVRDVASGYPELPILAYCRAGIEYSSIIRSLVIAGVHELIFVGRDDAGISLRAALDSARRETVASLLLARLSTVLPPDLHRFATAAVTHPAETSSLGALTRVLGVNRKTLLRLCAAHHLPPPSELLMWCRLATVAVMLSKGVRTVESIAYELGFASDTALRNRIKAYTGGRATDLRVADAHLVVLERLELRIAQIRAAQRPKAS